MNYPGNIKKNYKKTTSYSNRGMDLENLVNISNEYYLDKDMAIIYKKPTPINVVTYNYDTKKIVDAYYKEKSTLDYNGIYKGYYIEFDAKNTNKDYLPLANIADHQIKHMQNIYKHGGIVFLLIMINEEIYILTYKSLIEFINNTNKKSIPYKYIAENGINVRYNYLKGIDYLKGVDKLIEEM